MEVKPIDGGLIQTDPRNVITSLFMVTNTSSDPIAFSSDLCLPDGWKLITNDFIFTLNPGQSQTRLLSFFIPQLATAGLYEIPCTVQAQKYPSISDSYTIHVKVNDVTNISLQLINGPDFVIAGNEYQVDCVLINKSNQAVDIKIDVKSSHNFLYDTEFSELHLDPAESKPVRIRVISNADIKSKAKDQLYITAYIADNPDIAAIEKHAVDVIPRVFGSKDVYNRLPLKLKISQISNRIDGWTNGCQAELSGKGHIDENKKKYLSFLLKAPDQSAMDFFGQYDEYKVQYFTDHYDFGIGDLNFNLSTLTTSSFSARGTQGRIRVNRFGIGGYAAKNRNALEDENQVAAYLSYILNDDNLISLNYLSKSLKKDNFNIWSISSEINSLSDTNIYMEYALSSSDKNNSYGNNAFQTDILHNNEQLMLKLKSIYADSGFKGYNKDQKYISLAGSYKFTEYWRMNGDFVYDKRNLDLNLATSSALNRKYYRFRVSYNTPQKSSFYIDLIQENRIDLQTGAKFDFRENSVRIGTQYAYNRLCFNLMAETGWEDNYLSETESSFQRYTFSANYTHDRRLSGNGYLSYDTSNDFEGLDRQKLTFGIDLKAKIGERSNIDLSARSSKQFELENETNNDFKLSLDHMLLSKWKILNESSITADIWHSRSTNSYQPDGTSFKMSWTIPFNMPVSRKKSFGTVKGKVYDFTTKEPIADAVIRIDGQIAVTDSNGEFIFPNLPAGPEYLSANTSTIKENRIFCEKMPFAINVKSGETLAIDLPVIEPASFSGMINVYDFGTPGNEFDIISGSSQASDSSSNSHAGSDEFEKSGAIPNTLIEMVKGAEVTRRLTDQKGRFSFDALVPGKYIMKIKGAQIPVHHRLDKEEFEVELSRTEHKELEIKVLPIKRTMKMMPSMPIVIEGSE